MRFLAFIVVATALMAAPATRAAPTVIVAVGAEGASEYAKPFAEWADRWSQAAMKGQAKLIQIGRDAEGAEAGATDKDRLRRALADESKGTPGDPLWVVFIGHGTFDGKE